MSSLQNYNFIPTTVNGDQFLAYGQPAVYMTDYRPSSDLYAGLIEQTNQKLGSKVSGHQMREYLQNNAMNLTEQFFNTTESKFKNMEVPGWFNSCQGDIPEQNVYSGNQQMVNSKGENQTFPAQCPIHGQNCSMNWKNNPFPQQGPHCN